MGCWKVGKGRQKPSLGWCFSAFGWSQVISSAHIKMGSEGRLRVCLVLGLAKQELCSHMGKI